MSPSPEPFPRILFLTNEAPHNAGAGAIVFHRLFSEYPPEKMLVVTNLRPPAGAATLRCRYEHLPLAADRLNRTRFWPWRAALRVLGGASLLSLGRVDALLGGFQPDLVVTLMQDSWYYELAARYARARQLPLVLFIHDVAQGFEPVAPWLQARQQARDIAVFRQAARRLCISEGMVAHFSREFGLPGEVLSPPRSDATPAQSPESCRALKVPGRLTLGYAGGLHYGYGEQLLAMLPVLRETGTRVEMFGPVPSGNVAALNEATDVFRFNGYLSPPEQAWATLIQRCDVVLQPYLNPAGPHTLQYRTHFPSKLGDCLSLGLPLLVTGPEFAAGSAWCRARPGCALTLTDPSPAALANALGRLRDDPALRVSLAREAGRVGNEFAPAPLRQRLENALIEAARP